MRFDAVYHGHFKCNRWKLTENRVLWAYVRDLYQTPGFGDTVDFDHIKRHYYQVHTGINPTGIVPLGPDLSGWSAPHHREDLGGRPFGDGTPPGPVRADGEAAARGRPGCFRLTRRHRTGAQPIRLIHTEPMRPIREIHVAKKKTKKRLLLGVQAHAPTTDQGPVPTSSSGVRRHVRRRLVLRRSAG
ncbi:hypothetical protein SHIRM173S_04127 [Streptomyces hirsutus]